MSKSSEEVHGDEHMSGRNNKLRVHFVRHGQSYNNVRGSAPRASDPELTEVGRDQAQCVASWFAKLSRSEHIVAVCCSPMLRALQTAKPIVDAVKDAPFQVWDDAFEIGGCFTERHEGPLILTTGHRGLSSTEISTRFKGAALPPSITTSGWYTGTSEESEMDGNRRVMCLLSKLRGDCARRLTTDASGNVSIVLVVHADMLNALMCHLLSPIHARHEINHNLQFQFDTGSVSTIDFHVGGECVDIVALNRVGHLKG